MKTTNEIKAEFDSLDLIKAFEEKVVNKLTGEIDYIIFNIEIAGSEFRAYHEALSDAEKESDKIAFCRVEIDPDLSLDSNLAELYNECQQAIIDSEYFETGE